MCQVRSDEVEDAAERIRAGQASLADLQTWMAWPVRVHCGPTNEQALRWLLAEVERLTLAEHTRLLMGPQDWWQRQAAQYQALMVRLWRGGLGDPNVVDATDLVTMVCQFCGSKDEHDDSCPWLVLREFIGDEPEGEPYDNQDGKTFTL